jgi:hypothetical protein
MKTRLNGYGFPLLEDFVPIPTSLHLELFIVKLMPRSPQWHLHLVAGDTPGKPALSSETEPQLLVDVMIENISG